MNQIHSTESRYLQLILFDNQLGLSADSTALNAIDVPNTINCGKNQILGTSLGRKHGQNSSSTANIKDDLVFEELSVVQDGLSVAECSHAVFQHFLVDKKRQSTIMKKRKYFMDSKVRIRIEIIVGTITQ